MAGMLPLRAYFKSYLQFSSIAEVKVGIHLLRESDGWLYDFAAKVFTKKTSALTPHPLDADTTPNSMGVVQVTLDPAQFVDGVYTTLYYETTAQPPMLFDVREFVVNNGVYMRQPSTTEIAARILDASVGTSTPRKILAKLDAWLDTHK